MKVLWQREGVYSKYLSDNSWTFKFLPNWIGNWNIEYGILNIGKKKRQPNTTFRIPYIFFDLLENFAKWFQLKIMIKPKGMERIEDGALYFHPNDIRQEVLKKYRSIISST